MSMSRSSYYCRSKGRVRADEPQLIVRITALCERLPGTVRRVTQQLQREGWTINNNWVARTAFAMCSATPTPLSAKRSSSPARPRRSQKSNRSDPRVCRLRKEKFDAAATGTSA
jgi:hypothetical protein